MQRLSVVTKVRSPARFDLAVKGSRFSHPSSYLARAWAPVYACQYPSHRLGERSWSALQ